MREKGTLLAACVLAALGATALLLVAVGTGVVRQTLLHPARDGLEYRTLLSAVDELVSASPALRFATIDTVVGGRRVRYDSLIVEPGESLPPSLGEGGFLYGEVHRYNQFQRDWIALVEEDPAAFERLREYNPSIFRSYRRADGELGVTRTAAAWSRRVESPFEDEWTGAVRTGVAGAHWALSGPGLSVVLDRSQRLRTRSGRRTRACDFETVGDNTEVYCLSEARTAQATFHAVAQPGRAPALTAGWSPLRVDGVTMAPGDSASLVPGAVVRIDPLAPLVFGARSEGVLSGRQWVNGRMRRQVSSVVPLDVVAAIGRSPLDPAHRAPADADIVVALEPALTVELTAELGAFARALPVGVEFGGVVLSRIPDGALVAFAEAGVRSEPGRSTLLQRVVPGSAIKPILAAAILSQRPELGVMEIAARSGRINRVAGAAAVPSAHAFDTELHCAPPRTGRIDLRYFLRCSNNEYAATLLVAGLTPRPVTFAEGADRSGSGPLGRSVSRSQLLRSSVTEGLAALFDVSTDPVIVDARRRSSRVWEGVRFTDGSPVRVPYEVQPDESRPVLLSSAEDEGTDLAYLFRYAFGAWENRWNLFDLTEAFARVTTDRKIRLRFEEVQPGSAEAEPLGLSGQDWYPEFLGGLRGVAQNGTADGLAARWASQGVPGTLFAKTGTLAEGEERRGEGLYIKSLLFSVGETGVGGPGTIRCGVAGTVYLRFTDVPRGRSLPSYQVDFAAGRLGRFLERHWAELTGCGTLEP